MVSSSDEVHAMQPLDPILVKRESERIILNARGDICDWLPHLDNDRQPRSRLVVARRALILNAMLQIYFKAPTDIIRDWIERNGLKYDLAESESAILAKENGELSEQELTGLYWSIEALWSLMWCGSRIRTLPFDEGVQSELASMCPNLQINEDGSSFISKFELRPRDDLFRMLDLYFRLHWWTRNSQLTGQQTGKVQIDIVMERRKALEWVLDPECTWDTTNDGT
jgi:hypothetical protein